MRSPSDYLSVMRGTTISDVDLERLITGGDPEDTTLRDLAPLVARLRDQASMSPAPEEVASLSAKAASLAIAARPSAPTPRRRRGRMLPRLQPIGATLAILLVIGIGGTAYAADDAIPGDALYGLDRALESVGLGAGGADERIDEALALFEAGDTDGALEHAVEAITAIEGEEPVVATASGKAVMAAAAALDSDGGSGAHDEVMELLAYLSANVHRGVGDDGAAFGQRVAELARQIGFQRDGTANPGSDRPEPPTTTPDEGSGNGSQGNQGQGNQGNQGKQEQGNGNQGQANGNQGTSNADQGAADDLADPTDPAAPTDDQTEPVTSTTVGGNGNGNQGQGNGNGNQGQGNGNGNQGQGNGNENGNGPPTESPSITAPGQLNRP